MKKNIILTILSHWSLRSLSRNIFSEGLWLYKFRSLNTPLWKDTYVLSNKSADDYSWGHLNGVPKVCLFSSSWEKVASRILHEVAHWRRFDEETVMSFDSLCIKMMPEQHTFLLEKHCHLSNDRPMIRESSNGIDSVSPSCKTRCPHLKSFTLHLHKPETSSHIEELV